MSESSPGRTPLPPVDEAAVASYWATCVEALDLDPDAPAPVAEFFGDSVEMADELAALVVEGPKRATAGAIVEYEAEDQPLPQPGGHWIVLGGHGRPVGLVQTTQTRVGPLESVDDDFAWDEGEGDRTRDWWVRAHGDFFARALPEAGAPEQLELVFERFALVHVHGQGPVAEPRRSRGVDPS